MVRTLHLCPLCGADRGPTDANRGALLDAGFPQAIFSLLEGYAELVYSPPLPQPLPLAIPHLKVIRTAIGVLLNACVSYGTCCGSPLWLPRLSGPRSRQVSFAVCRGCPDNTEAIYIHLPAGIMAILLASGRG